MNTPTTIPHGPPSSDSWKETVSTLVRTYEFSSREGIQMPSLVVMAAAPRLIGDLALELGTPYQNIYYLVKRLCEKGYLALPGGASSPYRLTQCGINLLSKLNKHLHGQPTC